MIQHGGVAYLVPYVVLFFIIAMPVMFLELSLGQFISLGPVAIWKMSPLFKGLQNFHIFKNNYAKIFNFKELGFQ